MNYNETDTKTKVFYSVLFSLFFLIAAVIVPRLGITFSFLSFGGSFAVSKVTPDIMLALVVICSILSSNRLACVLGLIFGFLYDATVGIPYMFSPILYTLGGMFAPKFSESFAKRGISGVVVSSSVLYLAKAIITAFYHLATWREISLGSLIVGTLLSEFIYNMIAVLVLYPIVLFFAKLCKVEMEF